jgi:cellulose synthase (UDP-forming)
LVQITVFSWLNSRSRSAVLSDVYSLVLAFPLAITVVKVMLNPFGKGFKVTPKGGVSDRFSFNWQLAIPLIVMFIVTALSLWMNLGTYLIMGIWRPEMPLTVAEQFKGIGIGWVWSAYNLLMLSIALLILVDVPHTSPYEWYGLRRTIKFQAHGQTAWGITTAISEVGVEVALTQANLLDGDKNVTASSLTHWDEIKRVPVHLELMENELRVSGHITQVNVSGEFPVVQIMFEPLDLQQQRTLVELLYCRPGQWKDRCSPGEFASLGLLFKILLRPRFLFGRRETIRAIAVSQQ